MRIHSLTPLLSLALIGVASATTTVVSNTDNTAGSGASLLATYMYMPGVPMPPTYLPGPGTSIYTGSAVGNSFTTSSQVLPLESATLLLSGISNLYNFSVSIFSDNAGSPGSSLVQLSSTSPIISAGSYTFATADTDGYLLEANTTYWLIAALSTSTSYSSLVVGDTTDLSEASTDGLTIGTKVIQSNSGSITGSWTANTESALLFSLNSTAAIPEPTSAALIMLSGGLLLRRSRRAA